jgi:hypothetical protein
MRDAPAENREDCMFTVIDNHSYSSEDWNSMQRAHNTVSALLQRCPKEHEDAERLARTVMKLFNQGIRDEDVLVAKAAEQELMVSEIAERRDTKIAS